MQAAPPRQRDNIQLAATLVLVRETELGIEVYMTQRPGGMDFPDLHVFPGGKVSADDERWLESATPPLRGLSASEADQLLGEHNALRYWLAAVRESFEECGVLLARQAGGGPWVRTDDVDPARYLEWREALIDGRLGLSQLCAEQGLEIDLDALRYFSHWLTPDSVPRRYDTRFFLARMPEAQRTQAHAGEVVSGHWVAPSAALAHAAAGDWQLIAPTQVTLTALAPYRRLDDLWRAVDAGQHRPELTAELRAEGMCE
ncbi:MAG: NUDIX hydrolase [Pseudomonadota bacterium]